MRNLLLALLLLSLPTILPAQDKIAGHYHNHFNGHLTLHTNSTYTYRWHFDLAAGWAKGVWQVSNDTVFLHMIPLYDTVSRVTANGVAYDTLVLSTTETAERYTGFSPELLLSGGQQRQPHPEKLFFKKDRLYEIKDGKLVQKKKRYRRGTKKAVPWFLKAITNLIPPIKNRPHARGGFCMFHSSKLDC